MGVRGAVEVRCAKGVPPPTERGLGRRLCPLPENFDFGSQIAKFWCKLGAFIFCTVHLKLV